MLHREQREIGPRESLLLSAFYVTFGLLFGARVWWQPGAWAGLAYLTVFAVEKTLAMANVFVVTVIFSYFSAPEHYRHQALFRGVLGVVLLRTVEIGPGPAMVRSFDLLLPSSAVFVLVTGVRMQTVAEREREGRAGRGWLVRILERRLPVTREQHAERCFVRPADATTRRSALYAALLFLALVQIEFADPIVAVDSFPAILPITNDPFVVYTSNIFATPGLRVLYFARATMIERSRFPETALVLVFVGGKIVAADLLGIEKVPAAFSLGAVLAILAGGVAYGLRRTCPEPRPAARRNSGSRKTFSGLALSA